MHPDFYERKVARTMRENKKHTFELELKSIDEQGRFAGYASVFDIIDNQRDVVVKGAFLETLQDRISEIKLLWQHQLDTPIGYFTNMFEDARGLYVEGQLMLSLGKAREALDLMQSGVVKGLSIGFTPIRYYTDPDTGVRYLTKVALYEVSLVTMPANEQSRVSVVKASDYSGLSAAFDRAMQQLCC
ncbi:MAG: HK97 family phage prohead protease [Rickettsiales bacterium]|nr:HK97 family phage prohead protease [Rickettsiales bacterium]